jgi:ABC-type transport system involved in multi-copper enzyme maturation permease subunit
MLSRLDRLQHTRVFKLIASVAVIALAVAAVTSYGVAAHAPRDLAGAVQPDVQSPTPGDAGAAGGGGTDAGAPDAAAPAEDAADKQVRSAIESGERALHDLMEKRAGVESVAIAAAILSGLALVIIWLGLGLTYLGLILVSALVVGPVYALSNSAWAARAHWSTATTWDKVLRNAAFLVSACVALTASFTASMQAARVLLSASHPVTAVARNALAEAVRMKISLVFIVVLIFLLAALPLLLDPHTPLRYRVQSFLQYGTGGTFWVIAVLVLFFSAASVAFEQRDRQIWQTMTKPVSAWEYVLGKWLGVSTLAAVLLAVCSSGVFIFTEYLRQQPAEGERVREVAVQDAREMTEDRFILESQVLVARERVTPEVPYHTTDPEFQQGVKSFIEQNRARDPQFATDSASYEKVESDLFKSLLQNFRAIPAGEQKQYVFKGVGRARDRHVPLTLRYRIDSGSNDPRDLYKITFLVANVLLPPQEVVLGPTHTVQLPAVVGDNGDLVLTVVNGAVVPDGSGQMTVVPNRDLASIPEDGLEIYYSAGSYQANFFRVAAVLWVKLAFLAMLAIAASTFLSFPVACLIAFSVFIAAEGSGFLTTSLESYNATDDKGKVVLVKVLIRTIGLAVAWMFKTYSDLKPTERLVDGRMLDWSSVVWGCTVLAAWTLALFGAGVAIFRKRELATYSGH